MLNGTVEPIVLVNLLENHNTPHTFLLIVIGDVRHLSFHVLPIPKEGVPAPPFSMV